MKQYLDFWKTKGLKFITPKGVPDPEGFDIGEVLQGLTRDNFSILEVGCGTGRLAGIFNPGCYTGVDINPEALKIAEVQYPHHEFLQVTNLDGEYPRHDMVLLYTVALHIPDELLEHQFERFTKAAQWDLIIAEIMDPKSRENRDPDADYDISNQRSVETYMELMEKFNFFLVQKKEMPYKYYPGRNITFLKFSRGSK